MRGPKPSDEIKTTIKIGCYRNLDNLIVLLVMLKCGCLDLQLPGHLYPGTGLIIHTHINI